MQKLIRLISKHPVVLHIIPRVFRLQHMHWNLAAVHIINPQLFKYITLTFFPFKFMSHSWLDI